MAKKLDLCDIEQIIQQLCNVRNDINNNILGFGKEKCVASLDNIIAHYCILKNEILREQK